MGQNHNHNITRTVNIYIYIYIYIYIIIIDHYIVVAEHVFYLNGRHMRAKIHHYLSFAQNFGPDPMDRVPDLRTQRNKQQIKKHNKKTKNIKVTL